MMRRLALWRNRLDSSLLELLSGSILALVLKVIGAGIGFALSVVLARVLGPDGAGVYFLSLSAVTLAIVFGRMGLDKTVLRFVSAYSDIGEWTAVKGLQNKATLLAMISSVTVAAIMVSAAPWLANSLFKKPQLLSPLRWMSLAILPMTINVIYSHMLKGRKLIFHAIVVESIGVGALSLIMFLLVGRFYSVRGAIWSYILAAALTALFAIVIWHRESPQLTDTRGAFDTGKILTSSMPLFWVALTTWVIGHFGDFALGIWSTADDVGIYAVASRTALFISFALMAVNSIAAPQFAAHYHRNERRALARSARNAIRLTALAALPPTLVCVVAPARVMSIFGVEFVSGADVLLVIAVGQLINAASGPVELLLMMSGRERLVRTSVVLVGLLNIVLYIVLTPKYGALGAAVAFAIGLAMRNVVSIWLVERQLGLSLFSVSGLRRAKT